MRAFRKYGVDNFEFEVVEECEIEELNQKEIYWIDYFDTFFHGYNQTLGGDTTSRQPKENVIGIISDLINTDMLHKDIAAKWGVSTEIVQGINTGRYWKHNADYPLQKRSKKRRVKKSYYCEKCGKEISRGAKLCLDCYDKLRNSYNNKSRLVKSNIPDKETLIKDVYDLQGNFTKIGKKYGVTDNTIRKWCVKHGIPSKSSDYRKKKSKEKIREYKIGVIQLDINTNEELNRFESATEATRSLGVTTNCGTHILDVCRGKRKTAYGYKWKFA